MFQVSRFVCVHTKYESSVYFIIFTTCVYKFTNVMYSEYPIIRPLMVLVESGLNSEQVSLMSLIYVEKMYLLMKKGGLIARDVLNLSGSLMDKVSASQPRDRGFKHVSRPLVN